MTDKRLNSSLCSFYNMNAATNSLAKWSKSCAHVPDHKIGAVDFVLKKFTLIKSQIHIRVEPEIGAEFRSRSAASRVIMSKGMSESPTDTCCLPTFTCCEGNV